MRTPLLGLLLTSALLTACGRDDVWDQDTTGWVAHGLEGSVGIVDPAANRALMLTVEQDSSVTATSLPIGHGFASSATSPGGKNLLVLSRGDQPRVRATDEAPSLTVIDGGMSPKVTSRYELADPLSGLAVDPEARFAILYPEAADSSFVENPNELCVVDLDAAASATNPTPVTLRSFGGRPESFFFTERLDLPGGKKRLLLVLTDRDVGVLDLEDPGAGDITIGLSSSGERLAPAGVAVTEGDPASSDDARIAIRLGSDPNVVLVDLLPPQAGDAKSAHPFKPTPNLVFAGGIPSDLAFLKTDGGLRLGALIPSASQLTLIDPATGIASAVDLGAPYEHLSIVTGLVGGTESGADVALVWSESSSTIAFVSLGATVGKPYRAVDALELSGPVGAVLDVPSPNQHLKILASAEGDGFFVLDLVERTVAPIFASSAGGPATMSVAPDGRRAWVTAPEEAQIASLDLGDLHPQNLALAEPASQAFDVTRRGGGRALVAIEPTADVDLTVLDADHPSLRTATAYESVLLGSVR